MRRTAASLALAITLAACAAGPGPRAYRGPALRPTANPSAVIATELAFARAAQEKGQWTAFAEFATKDAVMFTPQPVNAQEWLKGRASPAQAVAWQPHQVWSSCDGSLAVTKGAWQRPDATFGYFITVWRRQEDGNYKWVLDAGDSLETPLDPPEMIQAIVADCPKRGEGADRVAQAAVHIPGPAGEYRDNSSKDDTLFETFLTEPDSTRTYRVLIWKDGEMKLVLDGTIPASDKTDP